MTSGADVRPERLLLDTSAYSHLCRGDDGVHDLVARADSVLMCAVVLGELDAGFRLGARVRENRRMLAEFLDEPFVVEQAVTPSVARRYGEVFAALRTAGTPLPTNDIWIAACALDAGAHLLTFDPHFDLVAGVQTLLLTA